MKTFFIVIALLCGAMVWVGTNVSQTQMLKYAKDKNDPSLSPKIAYYVGLFDYTRSDWEEAEPAFEQLLADYPTCQYAPEATIKLADAYYRKGRRSEAQGLYNQYLENWPEGELAGLAKKNLEMLGQP